MVSNGLLSVETLRERELRYQQSPRLLCVAFAHFLCLGASGPGLELLLKATSLCERGKPARVGDEGQDWKEKVTETSGRR